MLFKKSFHVLVKNFELMIYCFTLLFAVDILYRESIKNFIFDQEIVILKQFWNE